jgi:transposase
MSIKRKSLRKQYTPEQKAKIVLEVLREDQTLAQLAATYGVHANQLRKWKTQAVERFPSVFQDDTVAHRELEQVRAREQDALYAEIGRLTTELGWLKKKCGGFDATR